MVSEISHLPMASGAGEVRRPPRPSSRAVDFNNIPDQLRLRACWILWRWEWNPKQNKGAGAWVKKPCQCNGRSAASDRIASWNTFDHVRQAYQGGGFDGIGYALNKELNPAEQMQVIDLDHCFDKDDHLKEWGAEIVGMYNGAFIERSQSDGLHIWTIGSQEPKSRTSKPIPGDPHTAAKVELFDGGSPRFIYMTGVLWTGSASEIHAANDATEWLSEKYQIGKPVTKLSNTKSQVTGQTNDPDAEALKASARANDEDAIRSAARSLAPTREAWINYGMALKAGGYPFEFFHELSQGWPGYAGEDDCREHWDGFKPRGDIGVGSIFHDAKEAGWQGGVVKDVSLDVVPYYWSVPSNYVLDRDGLSVWNRTKSNTPPYLEEICGPVAVTAITVGVAGGSSGLTLEFISHDGKLHIFTVPLGRLHQDARKLAEEMAAFGFRIKPGQEPKLLSFLHASKPIKQLYAAGATGWVDSPVESDEDRLIYVFPTGATDPNFVFQPESIGAVPGVSALGTLGEWHAHVFALVASNVLALYEIIKSLAACLLAYYPAETCEHLYGRTTSGKTTLMQVGASVWGCGADPSSNRSSYIGSWNATANGLEGRLAAFNNLPAYLDELGTYQGLEFESLVYNATAGTGKAAMNANRTLRPVRKWATTITSTGEVSVREMLERPVKGQRATAKGGQMLRFIDRLIPEKTFVDAHQVDSLKAACGRYYGTLGPAFIQALVTGFSKSSLTATVAEIAQNCLRRLENQHPRMTTVERRALKRFALAEVAGILAVRFGLLPGLPEAHVIAVVNQAVALWSENSSDINDDERMVEALRSFVIANSDARFKTRGDYDFGGFDSARLYRELAGVFDNKNGLIYLFPQALAEATGLSAKQAAKELDRLGLLIKQEADRLTVRASLGNLRVPAYALRSSFVEGRGKLILEDLL